MKLDSSELPITVEVGPNELKNVDRYIDKDQIDKGGFGAIFYSMDTEIRRGVVVKRLDPNLADRPDIVQRFVREAQIMGVLEHPGVPPIYSMGKDELDLPFYSMKHIVGKTLFELARTQQEGSQSADIQSSRKLDRDLVRHLAQVSHTVDFAHSQGFIHRDLSPRNIMIGGFAESYVIDWGLAKHIEHPDAPPSENAKTKHYCLDVNESEFPLTLPDSRMGTPSYASPELAQGKIESVSFASDIFQLGANLYLILTGQAPYSGGFDDLNIQQAIFTSPRNIGASIPADLESICLKAMAREQELRYKSAAEFAQDLERWLEGKPVPIHSYTISRRTVLWLQNHPRTFIGGLVVSLISIFVLTPLALVLSSQNQSLKNEIRYNEGIADLDNFPDPNIQLKDALINAAGSAGERLSAKPQQLADILEAINKPLISMGEFELAIPLVEKALKIRKDQLGTNHKKTRDAAYQLGVAYYRNDAFRKAKKLFESTLKEAKQHGSDFEVAMLLNGLAMLAEDEGNELLAEKLYVESAARIKKLGPDEKLKTFQLPANRAIQLFVAGAQTKDQDKQRKGIGDLKKVIDSVAVQVAVDHPKLLTLRTNLAVIYEVAGEIDEAIRIHKTVLPLRERRLTASHQRTIESSLSLAKCYSQTSLEMFESQLKDLENRLQGNKSNTGPIRKYRMELAQAKKILAAKKRQQSID